MKNLLNKGKEKVFSKEDFENFIKSKKPQTEEIFRGTLFMRGTCGKKPCKGYYQ